MKRVKCIQEAQKLSEIVVVYVQSAANRADILTKPVAAKIFDVLRYAILNVAHSGEPTSVGSSSGATLRSQGDAGTSVNSASIVGCSSRS